jgi:hypothetical protein
MKRSKRSEFKRRSRAAKLGWKRRRARERREFLRRSRAAKLGWQRRRARELHKREPVPQPKFVLENEVEELVGNEDFSEEMDY